MTDMNVIYFSSRPMCINEVTPKKYLGFQQPYSMKGMFLKVGRLYLYVFIHSFMYILIGHFTQCLITQFWEYNSTNLACLHDSMYPLQIFISYYSLFHGS